MTRLAIHGIGIAAAGLADWASAAPVLRGEIDYQPEPFKPARTGLLPRNEARRAGTSVRLAFQAAEQACADADPKALATVFASSAADVDIADRLCRTLADPEGGVSPTQFHNSVHNTAAGYWSIATGSKQPASSVSGGRDSFATGLMEAWAMATHEGHSVLLVAFEAAGGGLLEPARYDVVDSCAVALVLDPQDAHGRALLGPVEHTREPVTPCAASELERYRQCNPAARALPLLAAIAEGAQTRVVVGSDQGNLAVELTRSS